jgi:hypothetical protein
MRRVAVWLLSTFVAGLVALGAPAAALACSGAPAVTAADLQAHTGTIAVVRVVDRFGQRGRPRGIVVALEDALRGRADPLIRLERPRQALGICHDMFTVRTGRRLLVAFDVQPLTGGGSLSPAWTVEDDGTLGAIYAVADARGGPDGTGDRRRPRDRARGRRRHGDRPCRDRRGRALARAGCLRRGRPAPARPRRVSARVTRRTTRWPCRGHAGGRSGGRPRTARAAPRVGRRLDDYETSYAGRLRRGRRSRRRSGS